MRQEIGSHKQKELLERALVESRRHLTDVFRDSAITNKRWHRFRFSFNSYNQVPPRYPDRISESIDLVDPSYCDLSIHNGTWYRKSQNLYSEGAKEHHVHPVADESHFFWHSCCFVVFDLNLCCRKRSGSLDIHRCVDVLGLWVIAGGTVLVTGT